MLAALFLAEGILEPSSAAALSSDGIAELLRPADATDGTYGLGVFVERVGDDVEVVGHAGSSRGWRAKMLTVPDRDAAIVILTNADGGTPIHVEVGCMWLAWVVGLGRASEACP